MLIIFEEFSKFEDFYNLSHTFFILEKILKKYFGAKICPKNPNFLQNGEATGDALTLVVVDKLAYRLAVG